MAMLLLRLVLLLLLTMVLKQLLSPRATFCVVWWHEEGSDAALTYPFTIYHDVEKVSSKYGNYITFAMTTYNLACSCLLLALL